MDLDEPTYSIFRTPSGMRWWIFDDGNILPVVSGGDGEDDDDDDDKGGKDDDKDKTFTQGQLKTMLANEKRQGKNSATREILEGLGFKSVEEATETVKGWRKADEDRKTEDEKRQEKLAQDTAEAERTKKEAAREKRIAQAERKLVAAGVVVKKDDGSLDSEASDRMLADAIKILDVDFDTDVPDDDLTSAIGGLKERHAGFFEGGSTANGGESNPKTRVPAPGNPPKTGGTQDRREKASGMIDNLGLRPRTTAEPAKQD